MVSDGIAESVPFKWDVSGIESGDMTLQFDFENPTEISSNGKSELEIVFWGSGNFMNNDNYTPMDTGLALTFELPRVMYSKDAALIATFKAIARMVTEITVIFIFAVCVLFGRSYLPLWSFLGTLQMIVHLPMFNVGMPAISEEFFRGLLTVVRFSYFNVHENLREYMGYTKGEFGLTENFNAATYHQTSSIINLGYFTPLLAVSIVLVFIGFIFDKLIAKTRASYTEGEKTTFGFAPVMTNFTIRLTALLYLELFLCVCMNWAANAQDKPADWRSTLLSVIIFIFQVLVLLGCTSLFFKKLLLDDDEQLSPYYDSVYTGLRRWLNIDSTAYPVYFMVQRILYVLVAVCIPHRPILQVICLLVIVTGMLFILLRLKPFYDSNLNLLHVINEFFLFLAVVHMYLFTNYVTEPTLKYNLSYSMVALVALFILFNLVHNLKDGIRTIYFGGRRQIWLLKNLGCNKCMKHNVNSCRKRRGQIHSQADMDAVPRSAKIDLSEKPIANQDD